MKIKLGVEKTHRDKLRLTFVFTTVENVSGKGKVLDCIVQNKICTKGVQLRNEGKNITCPDNNHKCTATLSNLEPIAQEGKYTSESLTRISEDHVKIGSVTSDGDVKIKKSSIDYIRKRCGNIQ